MRHRSVESVIVVDSWEQELTTLCLENSVYSSCKTLLTPLVRIRHCANSGKYDSRPSEDVFDGGKITGYEYNYDYDYRDQR